MSIVDLKPPSAPLLRTERLDLWMPVADDMLPMMAIVSEPETARYLGPKPSKADSFTRSTRNAGSWLLYGYGGFSVRERDKDALIGNCGIFHSWRGLGADFDNQPEAGWIIAAGHVGKGYGSEAMHAILPWFDEAFGPRRIVCMIEPENSASLKLAAKLGFQSLRDAELGGESIRLLARPA